MYYLYVAGLIYFQNMAKHKKGSGGRNYIVLGKKKKNNKKQEEELKREG